MSLDFLVNQADYNGEVIVALTSREEDLAFVNGARSLRDQIDMDGIDLCVVKEPTNNQICTSSLGLVVFDIELPGISMHSSGKRALLSPDSMESDVIETTRIVLNRLKEYEQRLYDQKHPEYLDGSMNISVTSLSAFASYSTLPGKSRLSVQIYFYPGLDPYSLINEFTRFMQVGSDERLLSTLKVNPVYFCQPYTTEPSQYDFLTRAVGTDIRRGFPAICDATALSNGHSGEFQQGRADPKGNFPIIICGPGDLIQNNAHVPDEYVSIGDLNESIRLDGQIMDSFLRGDHN